MEIKKRLTLSLCVVSDLESDLESEPYRSKKTYKTYYGNNQEKDEISGLKEALEIESESTLRKQVRETELRKTQANLEQKLADAVQSNEQAKIDLVQRL